MVIHKEYALRRFCEVPLEDKRSETLIEKICENPTLLQKLVFVVDRSCLLNTMVIAQVDTEEIPFELQLSAESEHLVIDNGGLKKVKQKSIEVVTHDPLQAWEVLRKFTGIVHVQLVFQNSIPDWYEEVTVTNEAIPHGALRAGFSVFMREQIDLLLWGITLKEQIDQALRTNDEKLFRESVKLYKKVCQACFWRFS